MRLIRGTILDDRGHVVGLIEPTRTSLDRSARASLPILLKGELMQRTARRTVFAAFVGCIAVGVLRISLGQRSRAGIEYTFPLPLALGFFIPILFYGLINNLKWAIRHRRKLAEAALDAGLCAQCLYRVKGLRPEPDGCTLCPECGSAWRVFEPAADRPQAWWEPPAYQ